MLIGVILRYSPRLYAGRSADEGNQRPCTDRKHKIRTFESMRSCDITSHIQVNISLCKQNVNSKVKRYPSRCQSYMTGSRSTSSHIHVRKYVTLILVSAITTNKTMHTICKLHLFGCLRLRVLRLPPLRHGQRQ